jgi:hypothetical protein
MNTLRQLQEWYRNICDDNWEHRFGIKIDTLDNPGRSVVIDMEGTPLEKKDFSPTQAGVDVQSNPLRKNWIVCRKEEKQFRAFGGPFKLEEMLQAFLYWKNTHS